MKIACFLFIDSDMRALYGYDFNILPFGGIVFITSGKLKNPLKLLSRYLNVRISAKKAVPY